MASRTETIAHCIVLGRKRMAPLFTLFASLGAALLLLHCGVGTQLEATPPLGTGGGSTAAGIGPDSLRYLIRETWLQDSIEVYGTLTPEKTVSVGVEYTGTVATIHVEAGDEVQLGDLLAELHDERIDLAFRQAEIGLELAERERELASMRLTDGERMVEAALLEIEQARIELSHSRSESTEVQHRAFLVRELHRVGGSTDRELRSAEHALQSAESRVELAAARLQSARIGYRETDLKAAGLEVPTNDGALRLAYLRLHTRRLEHELRSAESRLDAARLELRRAELSRESALVRSPMNGVIGDRFLVEGERAAVGDRAFTVLSLDQLEFVGEVGEDRQSRLEIGAPVEIRTARGNLPLARGVVIRVAPYLDPARRSRALRVHLQELEPEAEHRPGLLSRAVIHTGPPEPYLTVDEAALHEAESTDGRPYLLVLRGTEHVKTPVKLKGTEEGQVLFTADVRPGEYAVARDVRY